MTLVDPPLSPPLAAAMREATRGRHQAAEGSDFMAELLAGRVPPRGYVAYLRRLRVVYAALETAVRARAEDPLVAAVHDPGLERGAAIERDLTYWLRRADDADDGSDATGGDSPAARAYAQRIEAAAATWGGVLVAHHYTRYLGDLSGGRAIGQVLERTFGTGGAGTDLYRFDTVDRPAAYKAAYRTRLDLLPLDHGEVARVVTEVGVAFSLNQSLLAELGEELPRRPRG